MAEGEAANASVSEGAGVLATLFGMLKKGEAATNATGSVSLEREAPVNASAGPAADANATVAAPPSPAPGAAAAAAGVASAEANRTDVPPEPAAGLNRTNATGTAPALNRTDTASSAASANRTGATPANVAKPGGAPSAGSSSGEHIFKTLVSKVKALELNQSLVDGYIEDLNRKYIETFNDIDAELGTLTEQSREVEASVAAVQARVDDGDARMRAQLERMLAERLTPLTQEVAQLRLAKDDAQRRELAAGTVVGMLAGALLLGFGRGSTSKLFRVSVAVLSLLNGVAGVLLHAPAVRGALARALS